MPQIKNIYLNCDIIFLICDTGAEMEITQRYISRHLNDRKYTGKTDSLLLPGYKHKRGWTDIIVGNDLIFSHRNTYYTKENFTEGLHAHEYYELLVYISGNVEYINENRIIKPGSVSTIWFKPGQMHTARLIGASQYERYVFYFSRSFFEMNGRDTRITDFMEKPENGFAICHSADNTAGILSLLRKADAAVTSQAPFSDILLRAYIVELLGLLNYESGVQQKDDRDTGAIADVRQYIDSEYATITSISEIAGKFYYSREHLSRKFRESYNISISKYISKRRVIETLGLLEKMNVADAAFAVGFRSQSAYIAAFKENIGCLPSEYKMKNKQTLHF